MADVVLRPTFAAAEVRRQRDLRLASLLQQKRPAATRSRASPSTSSSSPRAIPTTHALGGDSTSTARLDSAMVRAFHDASYRPGARRRSIVVGDLSEAEARALLAAALRPVARRGPERTPAPVLVQPVAATGVKVVLVDKPGAAQSVIQIGTMGVERTNADYAAIEVMNTILGGSFSSRLNSNLRETKGYTYGAGSGFSWRPLPGPFTASSSVRTNVTDSSLVEFFSELRRHPRDAGGQRRARARQGVPRARRPGRPRVHVADRRADGRTRELQPPARLAHGVRRPRRAR